jgi:hypothetical protein
MMNKDDDEEVKIIIIIIIDIAIFSSPSLSFYGMVCVKALPER